MTARQEPTILLPAYLDGGEDVLVRLNSLASRLRDLGFDVGAVNVMAAYQGGGSIHCLTLLGG